MWKSPAVQQIYRIVLYGVGLTSVYTFLWMVGPYVSIGGFRPFDNYIIRETTIVLITVLFASLAGFQFFRRRKAAQALAAAVTGEEQTQDDSEELAGRMKDALATLKQASGGKTEFLYDLPWYIIIGPPGSGKTTALVNSGLKFPLSAGATPAAIAGVGGTRYCDWWFTEDAVMIDTAGRYTTQDSDARADKQSWFSFLDLLKKNRPRQPINGVLVAISLHDILTLSPEELAAHARAIRARLLELHERLKIDFPVYAVFTKGDMVAGFMEYFGHLGENGRRNVWGATFQTTDKTRNLVSEVPAEFDRLIERLNQEMPDRLQDEPAPNTRVALYGFPAQMASLKRPLFDFLNAIFEPTRYHANATLRGFYFTSGTQLGTPIDQLINALVKNFGAEDTGAAVYSGVGKSFFLTDLIQKVIIGEAAWVSTDPGAVRRQRILKAAGFAAVAAVAIACIGAWWGSYGRNSQLIAATDAGAKEYAAAAGPLAREDVIADRDYDKVLPLLQTLRYLPTGHAQHDQPVPLAAGFGLSQAERLGSATETAYRMGLERLFRPRLLYRLEEVLDINRGDPSYVYEALKAYMMLGGLQPADRDLLVSWHRRDWEDLYPGPSSADGRKLLEEHLLALLDLESSRGPLVQISSSIVEESQQTLARLSVAQRAYEIMKSQARTLNVPDWVAARAGGSDFERVFDSTGGATIDAVRVPGFYTYAGFHRAFVDRLPDIADKINRERWVLGKYADQGAVAEQYRSLPQDLLDLYSKDFVAAWRTTLGQLELKRLTVDRPRYLVLGAAAASTSPIRLLFESIRDETQLTRERADQKPAEGKPQGQAQPARASLFADPSGEAPGARIENQFRPFHEWVEGATMRRPIDEVIGLLSEIKDNLITSANVPAQAAQANALLQTQVQRFRAQVNRMPDPFKDMLLHASGAFESDVNNSELSQLAKALGDQVVGACQQVVNGRYPFVRGASSEIALQDFGRLFGPGGIIDRFFQQSLSKYANISNRNHWTWQAAMPVTRGMSAGTLRQFQRAAQIRDTFFGTGGNIPSVPIQVFPPVLAGSGVTARFEVNGAAVVTQAGTSVTPQAITWPGAAMTGRSAVSLTSDVPGLAPAVLERNGAWALFRLLDAASKVNRGDRLIAGFLVGGRELQYQLAFGTAFNPYTLPALREFRCPTGL